MSATALPLSLAANPSPAKWVRFDPDRTVHLSVGKVEIGQGILTALRQIAAEELDVALSAVRILSGDTDLAPDEASTTSSLSIEVGGTAVRLVTAEVRVRVLARLAQRLNCAPDDIAVIDGAFYRGGQPTGQDYWSVAPEVDLARAADGATAPKPVAAYRVVGQSAPRLDLPAKLAGAAFIQDMVRPDLLHARILRQPSRGARLAALDEAAIRRAAGGALRVLRHGNFVALLSENETVAQRAAMAAPGHASWENVRQLTPAQQAAAWLVGQPSDDRVIGDPLPPAAGPVVEATYTRPYIAHASIGPSCALAELRDGHLSVWSHTQGVYPLRNALARVLDRKAETISVHHVQGAGCYGHNGADDAALDAAVIATLVPDHCIRVQWRREDEFGFEPLGSAMSVTMRAVVDAAGRPADWTAEIWSGSHVQRPAMGGNLLAHEALPTPAPDPRPTDPTEAAGGGGTRNAIPHYAIPGKRILHHLVPGAPVRTSALRGLGAVANVFALESFMDELAARAGADPVAYRLGLLGNSPRAARVIARVAEMAGWNARGKGGDGRGLGIGFAQYKNRSAYAAVAAEVEVDQEVRLRRVWCAADAGLVVNPDGLRNQLEGGILQAASFTLKEQVTFNATGVGSIDWESYPILRFSEVPEEMTCELVDAPEERALGVGECTLGPTAAAIGNAVAHALGMRIRDMPFTRDRIAAVLLQG
ncbi:MAG: xanthine dehydrogenase family protein molybdopterin-binding subunit [Rhodospirillales bacterium]|nr:xanthine dehydrogenase family protein molybdopterin-binding subunit [Rhodospirillales bacterium]